jgi:hypothetical protein
MTTKTKSVWAEKFQAISRSEAAFGSDFSNAIPLPKPHFHKQPYDELREYYRGEFSEMAPRGASRRPDYDDFGAVGKPSQGFLSGVFSTLFGRSKEKLARRPIKAAHARSVAAMRAKSAISGHGGGGGGHASGGGGHGSARDPVAQSFMSAGVPGGHGSHDPLSGGYYGAFKAATSSDREQGWVDRRDLEEAVLAEIDDDEFAGEAPKDDLLPTWLLAVLGIVGIWGVAEALNHRIRETPHSHRLGA